MAQLHYKNRSLSLKPYESVLDCLLRHGESLPYACKAGMCQACLIRAVDCAVTEESRKWIKPDLQARGYTLACQWVPTADVGAEPPRLADFAVAARIQELQPLNNYVLQVKLEVTEPRRMFSYRPGQYLTLTNATGITRAYSIANDFAREEVVELHISSTTHGEFTGWLFAQATPGDAVFISGPAGSCHYDARDDSDQALLLAGTGTGLAPLYGIVRDALAQGHQAPIVLFHGGRTTEQLYLTDALRELAAQHANFSYFPSVTEARAGQTPALFHGRVEEVLEQNFPKAALASSRIFLCGQPDFVHSMRKRLYLKGARSEHIHCDPFTERTVSTT